jgi:integrase
VLSTETGKRKTIYGVTAEEVQDKLTRARNQQLDHIPFTDERLTVAHWLKTWLDNTKPPTTAPKTWITYEGFVRLHFTPLIGHIRLVKLSPQDVRDFMSNRLDAGLSGTTVKQLRIALRAALQQAVNDDVIQRNVAGMVKSPEPTPRTIDVYTPEEACRLIEAARVHRLEALFVAAPAVALRKGECLGLQWGDIDFARRQLTVRHNLQRLRRVRRGDVVKEGEAKTERYLGQPKGKKVHSIPLPTILVEALERRRIRQAEERALAGAAWRGEGDYVFTSSVGTPLEPRNLDRIFKGICDRAGLRQIRFHDLRHSAASILIAQRVHPKAIQALLRHSSSQITMDIYGHLFESVQRETADKMDEILGRKEGGETQRTVVKTVVNPGLRRVK